MKFYNLILSRRIQRRQPPRQRIERKRSARLLKSSSNAGVVPTQKSGRSTFYLTIESWWQAYLTDWIFEIRKYLSTILEIFYLWVSKITHFTLFSRLIYQFVITSMYHLKYIILSKFLDHFFGLGRLSRLNKKNFGL